VAAHEAYQHGGRSRDKGGQLHALDAAGTVRAARRRGEVRAHAEAELVEEGRRLPLEVLLVVGRAARRVLDVVRREHPPHALHVGQAVVRLEELCAAAPAPEADRVDAARVAAHELSQVVPLVVHRPQVLVGQWPPLPRACLVSRAAAAARSKHVDRDGQQEGARADDKCDCAPLAMRVSHTPAEELQQDHRLAVSDRAGDYHEARLEVAPQEVRGLHLPADSGQDAQEPT